MDVTALILSVELAALTTVILLVLGLPLAWWLVVSRWRAKFLVEAVVALPLILPPTVLGFYLLVGLGPHSPAGQLFEAVAGHPFPFSFAGLLVASLLYSLPFAVQPFAGALAGVERRFVEATTDGPDLRIAIAHANADEWVGTLSELAWRVRPKAEIEFTSTLGAVVGTHVGPGAVGFFWFQDTD